METSAISQDEDSGYKSLMKIKSRKLELMVKTLFNLDDYTRCCVDCIWNETGDTSNIHGIFIDLYLLL
jgi:hypothetical protein